LNRAILAVRCSRLVNNIYSFFNESIRDQNKKLSFVGKGIKERKKITVIIAIMEIDSMLFIAFSAPECLSIYW
jgi:hypothetical protein